MVHAIRRMPGALPRVDDTTCPYRGMEVFEERHARWMFGREDDVQTSLAHLRDTSRLLPLVGASGSGKSSLVRAGLVPAVRTGELDGSFDWRIAVMRPQQHPLNALATAVVRLAGPDVDRLAIPSGRDPVDELATLARKPTFLTNMISLLAGDESVPPGVLLVVDQFEELFTEAEVEASAALRAAKPERKVGSAGRLLVQSLLDAAAQDDQRIHVVFTLRADFLPPCLRWPELARALDGSMRVALSAMGREQVKEAIRRPALSVGADVEPAVVHQLVDGVADQPGSLPLLQHCLIEMWARRDPETQTLTWSAYRAVGGLHGAMTRTAERMLQELDEASRPAVRWVLGRLIHHGQGTGDTRRSAPLAEFREQKSVQDALDALVEHRLVTVSEGRAQIAHEALLREWQTLQRWLREDRGVLQLRQEGDRGGSCLGRGGSRRRHAVARGPVGSCGRGSVGRRLGTGAHRSGAGVFGGGHRGSAR